MPANAYFISAIATCAQVRPTKTRTGTVNSAQIWDACQSRVVFGNSAEDAQSQFEAWLGRQPDGENPLSVVIQKIAAAQFADRLLTESGNQPLNWTAIAPQIESSLATPEDDFEQGYWVDVDQIVHPGKLSFSVGTLESDVPQDIRSGLNWSADRKFFFVVNVLALPSPAIVDVIEPVEIEGDDSGKLGPEELANLCAIFPIACDKAAVGLVQARNSVIAAWLWRTYSAKLPFALNPIRIDPWPGTLNAPDE